jgi:integration host factor subunit alpha
MTVTKAELSQKLSDKLNINKRESKEIVEDFFDQIAEILETGEDIKLSGFGNFELRDKTPRPGRNPRTGQDVPITARRVVTFKPGQKLRALVEGKKTKQAS